MVKKLRRRLGVLAVLSTLGAAALASVASGQVPETGVDATYCVNETGLSFEITAIVTVGDDPPTGYIEVIPVSTGAEYFRIDYTLESGVLTVTGEPVVTSVGPPDNLQDGPFSYTLDANWIYDGNPYDTYQVDFEGLVPHGTVPLTTSDVVNYTNAYDREFGGILVETNAAILDCEGPPVTTGATTTAPPTTTTAPPTTTGAPTTTTEPPSTTAEPATTTAAPTTTVAVGATSTLPATGIGDGIRATIPLGLALLLAGALLLGGAALIGKPRRT